MKQWLSGLLKPFQREPHNREEFLALLNDLKTQGLLNQDNLVMIEGVLNVTTKQVSDIMVSRGQMVVIECDSELRDILPVLINSSHSRFPVIGENKDQVLGILLAKDLLRFINTHPQAHAENDFSLKNLIRPAVFVPESKRIDILLHEFRNNRYHMAIVVDEFGGTAGLVTIEDVLEEIVGEIEDETDVAIEEPNIVELQKNSYRINPLTPIEEFNRFFNTDISNDDFDTIAGYIMQQVGHMPKKGENVHIGHYELHVIQASRRRLQQIKLTVHTPHEK
jgi:magnesium and cobalt transporter